MAVLANERRTQHRAQTHGSLSMRPRAWVVAVAVGLASLLVSEFMHFLLVPDIGRRWERWLAEIASAAIVGMLAAMLMKAVDRHRAAALLRLQVISEMNAHVRAALSEICLTPESIENQESIRKISENVEHIEWALREILLRRRPMAEGRRPAMRREMKMIRLGNHNQFERDGEKHE